MKGKLSRPPQTTNKFAMERVKHIRSSTKKMINGNEREPFLEGLGKEIINGDMENAYVMLDTLEKQGNLKWLQMYHNTDHEGETLLHLAVKYHDNESFVRKLSELCPSLLLMARELSLEFRGQTALHMAITKGNIEAIQVMLEVGQFKDIQMATLLHTRATGSRFVNTVMMGQLPLTVAALKGNADIVDILLQYGADMLIQNEEGDTVFHSLIKYSATYPEKVVTMLYMLRYLNQKIEEKDGERSTYDYSGTDMYREPHSFVWFLKNNDNLSPLQLAAKHGVTELFEEILNIKDVYCFISANDGLFDVKEYDVTEIDTVSIIRASANRHPSSVSYKKSIPKHIHGIAKTVVHSNETQCAPCGRQCCTYPETESILEMLFQFGYDNKDAYRIIELAPVKNIIKMKWSSYQWFFILWMIFHYSFMIMLTIYSVHNAELNIPTVNTGVNATALSESFVYGFRWVSFAVGILYGCIAICLLSAKIRKNNIRGYLLHNLEYIFPMLILSVMMIVDVLWSITEQHDNIPLIIALVCGWWLNIFFLSPIKHFSFFTEMIKRVIIGDLFRFGLVILFGLFSFTAGMYMVFRGSEEMQNDFSSYGSTMMAMFKLGIGIEDISVLYAARIPWAAITIFALFTIFTYLLMLNALIAMMSQTCSLVLEEQFPQWRVQQLSVILFIEDIICLCCFRTILSCAGTKKRIRGSDPITKQIKYEDRYFLEIHSLHMEYATTEDKVWAKKKSNEMQTLHPQLNVNDTLTMSADYHDHPVVASISPIRPSVKRFSSRYLNVSANEPVKSPVEKAGSDSLQPSLRRKKSTKEKKRKPLEKLDEMNTEEEQEENAQYLRQVAPKSPEVLSDRSPTRKPTPKSQRKRYLSENDKELRSQGVQHSPVVEIDPPVYRVNLARVPLNGLNIQKGPKEIEYEIRNLT